MTRQNLRHGYYEIVLKQILNYIFFILIAFNVTATAAGMEFFSSTPETLEFSDFNENDADPTNNYEEEASFEVQFYHFSRLGILFFTFSNPPITTSLLVFISSYYPKFHVPPSV